MIYHEIGLTDEDWFGFIFRDDVEQLLTIKRNEGSFESQGASLIDGTEVALRRLERIGAIWEIGISNPDGIEITTRRGVRFGTHDIDEIEHELDIIRRLGQAEKEHRNRARGLTDPGYANGPGYGIRG